VQPTPAFKAPHRPGDGSQGITRSATSTDSVSTHLAATNSFRVAVPGFRDEAAPSRLLALVPSDCALAGSSRTNSADEA